MSKARPARPVSAAQAADWPRLSEARGSSLMHAEGSLRREPACRKSLCHLVVDTGVKASVSMEFSKDFSAAVAAESTSTSSGGSSAKDAKHRRTPSGSWPFGSRKAPQPVASPTHSSKM